MFGRQSKVLLLVLPLLAVGCALLDDPGPKKPAPTGLIATPPSYYSTAKARYLGGKYKENLDRIVERIVRNTRTSNLQFANNISSVGGIGFFTHSAAKTTDERYLEVVLATPETFETKGELSDKVHRLFSQYGSELLGIISGDSDIYQDKELSGYGLNLAWRNILAEPAGNRVTMARAIIYFPKERVRNFLRQELSQNDLLGSAVIYSVEEDGPLTLVSYQPREMRPDFRPAILEDDLASVPAASKATSSQSAPAPGKEPNQKAESKIEVAKKEPVAARDVSNSTVVKPSSPEAKVESKQVAAAQKSSGLAKQKGNVSDGLEKPKPMPRVEAEQGVIGKHNETTGVGAPANESKVETTAALEVAPSVAHAVTPPAAKPESQETTPVVSREPAPAPKTEDARKSIEETRQEPSAPRAQKSVVETKKNEPEVKQIVEAPKPPLTAPKSVIEAKRPEMVASDKPVETSIRKLPGEKPVGAAQRGEKSGPDPATAVAKIDPPAAPIAPVPASAQSTLIEKVSETKAREPIKTEAPAVKSTEGPRPVEAKAAIPATPIAKAEVQSQAMKAPTSVSKAAPKEEIPDVRPQERAPAQKANENKTADLKAPEKVAPAAPIVTAPIQSPAEKMKAVSTTEAAKVETPAPRIIETVPAQVKPPQANVSAVVAAPAPAAKSTTDPTRPRETPKPDLGPSVAKAPVIEAKALPPVVTAPPRETSAEKPSAEQIALLKKPAEIVPEKRPMARPEPKALEGFIIQLGFNDKEKARRWAEAMERRGYAVSITEAGAEGALRVRLGNFALRDEAERQLRSFKQEGLRGIIINLPQGFRPEARSSIP